MIIKGVQNDVLIEGSYKPLKIENVSFQLGQGKISVLLKTTGNITLRKQSNM